MPVPKPLRILFKAATGITALGTSAMIAVNIGNAHFYDGALSPLEFATRDGSDYSQKTKAHLHQFDDVRMVEITPGSLNTFCEINFFVCGIGGSVDGLGNFAYTPNWFGKTMGLHPTIFLRRYSPNLMNQTLEFTTGKQSDVMTADHARMIYDFSVFHEVGHIGVYRQKGERYFTMPIRMNERGADITAIPFMKAEYGLAGKEFVLHLRALTQVDFDHENLLPLKYPLPDDETTAEDFEFHAHASWVKYADFVHKCTGTDPRKISYLDGVAHDALYRCTLKEAQPAPVPGQSALQNAFLADRKKSYVAAYNYFFGPPNP